MTNELPARPPARRYVWPAAAGLVLAGAAALFLVRLGDRAVVSEEVRWAEVAREMRASGDYLHPTINGGTYYDKPLGSYWLVVAASHVTGGVDEAAARLPAAVAGWAGVLLVILLGRRVYDAPTGVLAGAVLATSLGFALYARRATADVETVTGVLAAVWWADRHRDRPGGPWVIGLWLVMAVTSLTKGLLGFALPVAVLLAHGTWLGLADHPGPATVRGRLAAVVRGNPWLLTAWTAPAGFVAAAVYFLPFLLSVRSTGAADGLEMVWRENVRRFVSPHNHTGPVYLYAGVVFVLAAPWSVFLPAALVPGRRAGPVDGDRLVRAYFWAVFGFFTLAASRRSYYLLPVLPAVALLVARSLLAQSAALPPFARALRTVGWAGFGLVVAAAGVALLPPGWVLPPPYDQLPELPDRAAFAAGWAAALAAFGWAAWRARGVLPGVATVAVAGGLGYAFWVALPAADGVRTRPPFAAAVRERTAPAPDRLALYHARDAVFDLGRTAPDYTGGEDLVAAMRAGRVRWVVARRRYLAGTTFPASIVLEEAVRPWEGPDQVGDKLVLLEAAPDAGR